MVGLFIGYQRSDVLLNPTTYQVSERNQLILQNPTESGFTLSPINVQNEDNLPFRAFFIQKAPIDESGTALNQRRIQKVLEQRNLLPPLPSIKGRGTIILLHDWNKSLEDCFTLAEILTGADFNCIIFDARAHGERIEESVTYGETEINDIKRVILAAKEQFPDLGSFGIYGQGLGGALALIAASEIPEIRCVVAEESFTTLKDQYWHQLMNEYNQDKRKSGLYFLLTDQVFYWRLGKKTFNIAPIGAATRLKVPCLIVSNEKNDPFAAYSAQKLYTTIASTHKNLLTQLPTEDGTILTDNDFVLASIVEWFAIHTHSPHPDLILPKTNKPLSPSI